MYPIYNNDRSDEYCNLVILFYFFSQYNEWNDFLEFKNVPSQFSQYNVTPDVLSLKNPIKTFFENRPLPLLVCASPG